MFSQSFLTFSPWQDQGQGSKKTITEQRESLLSVGLGEHRPLIVAKGTSLHTLLIKTDCVSEFPGKGCLRETQKPVAVHLPIDLTMKLLIHIK